MFVTGYKNSHYILESAQLLMGIAAKNEAKLALSGYSRFSILGSVQRRNPRFLVNGEPWFYSHRAFSSPTPAWCF